MMNVNKWAGLWIYSLLQKSHLTFQGHVCENVVYLGNGLSYLAKQTNMDLWPILPTIHYALVTVFMIAPKCQNEHVLVS